MQKLGATRNTQRIVPVVKLVIVPTYIASGQSPIYALHIRSGLSQPFEIFPLDQMQYDRYFKLLDVSLNGILKNFTIKSVEIEAARLRKLYQKKKAGKALELIINRNLIRYYQQQLLSLLHLQPTLSFYHKVNNVNTSNWLIEKCVFSTSTVQLQFEFEKSERAILYAYYQIGEHKVLIDAVVRYGFLIYLDGAYYFLNWLDVQTLDWLATIDLVELSKDAAIFQSQILQKLNADYKVKVLQQQVQELIITKPVNAVFLSELSNSLLVINPRWLYNNVQVEGAFEPIKSVLDNGLQRTIQRDEVHESAFIAYLQSLHPQFSHQKGYFFLKFEEARKGQWFLHVYHQLLKDGVQIIGFDMLQHFRYTPYAMEQNMQIKKTIDHLVYFEWTIYFGLHSCLLKDVQKMLLASQHSLMLPDGSIAVFKDEWVQQYGVLLRHAVIDNHKIAAVPIWLCLSTYQLQEATHVSNMLPADWQKNWQAWQSADSPVYPVPKGLRANLRGYQHKGFEWMQLLAAIRAGGILSDDMGLGKTLQSITYIVNTIEQQLTSKHLIVCPSSLVYNWQQELEKFAPGLQVYLHAGANRNEQLLIGRSYQVCITSYTTLRSDIAIFQHLSWYSIFLDESHYIKNLQAQVSKAVMMLNGQIKFCLSGTPILNNTNDLYAQFKFILPDLLGTPDFFRKYYADAIDKSGSEKHASQLKALVAPFILKRNKQQVAADLPLKTEAILWCEMEAEQAAAYTLLKAQVKENVLTGISVTGMEKATLSILAGIAKLRQFCAAPQLVAETSSVKSSIKLDLLLNELTQLIDAHAVLVFSQYVGVLQLIAERLKAQDIAYYLIDGSTTMQERAAQINAFQQADNDVKVFLLTLKTGNAGLNLTQADYVFLVDPWWNAAVENQAIDRTHRIGQTKNVMAYRMICKNTIEEKILQLQNKKTKVSEQLIVYEEGFTKQLTMEDLAFLFD